MKPAYLTLAIPALLAACATGPESDPSYVSPTQYDTYSCDQMRAEMQRVSKQIDQFSQQDKPGSELLSTALTAYAISQGYGFSQADNVKLRRAQNKYNILDEMMIKKNCTQ
jgi:hypothetical protein